MVAIAKFSAERASERILHDGRLISNEAIKFGLTYTVYVLIQIPDAVTQTAAIFIRRTGAQRP